MAYNLRKQHGCAQRRADELGWFQWLARQSGRGRVHAIWWGVRALSKRFGVCTRTIVGDLAWHRDEGHLERVHRGRPGFGRSSVTFIAPSAAQRPYGALAREWLGMPDADINDVQRAARARVDELQRRCPRRLDPAAEAVRARMELASITRKAAPSPPLKPSMALRGLDLLRRLDDHAHYVCDQRQLVTVARACPERLDSDIRMIDQLRRSAWRARRAPSDYLTWSWSDYLRRIVDDERTKIVDIPDTLRAWARSATQALARQL